MVSTFLFRRFFVHSHLYSSAIVGVRSLIATASHKRPIHGGGKHPTLGRAIWSNLRYFFHLRVGTKDYLVRGRGYQIAGRYSHGEGRLFLSLKGRKPALPRLYFVSFQRFPSGQVNASGFSHFFGFLLYNVRFSMPSVVYGYSQGGGAILRRGPRLHAREVGNRVYSVLVVSRCLSTVSVVGP